MNAAMPVQGEDELELWAGQVRNAFPGGPVLMVARALAEVVDPFTRLVDTGRDAFTVRLARRAHVRHFGALRAACDRLTEAGLLLPAPEFGEHHYEINYPGRTA